MGIKAKISFTNTTYNELRDALIARIPNITDNWTDFNESDIGITLLELFCGVGTFLNYMIDRRVNELFLANMRERKHGIMRAKSYGYKFHGAVAALTMLRFTIPSPISKNVHIPRYTRCISIGPNPTAVVTMEATTIPSGQLLVDVVAWQGVDIRPTLDFTTTSDPPPYVLTDKNIAHGSVEVSVEGEPWVEVDHFVGQRTGAKVYRILIDHEDNTWVEFGDGFEGAVPVGTVAIFYIVTRAADGNGGSGVITQIEDPVTDSNGNAVSLSVTNTSVLAGGSGVETLYHAKKQIPSTIQANERGVTNLDLAALSEGFPGVRQVQVIDINDYPIDSFEMSYYQIRIPVVPDNEGLPGQALKEALYNFLVEEKGVTFPEGLEIRDPDYVIVDVDMGLVKHRKYKDSSVILTATSAVQDFVKIAESPLGELELTGAIDGLTFAQDVDQEQLVRELVSLTEVSTLDHLRFTANGAVYGTGQPEADVPIGVGQIAILGNITAAVTGEI